MLPLLQTFLSQHIEPYLPLINAVCYAMTSVVILATALVRFPPLMKYEPEVGKAKGLLISILHFLPTIGVNPQTKKLEEALEFPREK